MAPVCSKKNSSVNAKFRVCDANGVSIGSPGVVASFMLVKIDSGTASSAVNEPVDSTTPDSSFKWDSTAQQWMYDISQRSPRCLVLQRTGWLWKKEGARRKREYTVTPAGRRFLRDRWKELVEAAPAPDLRDADRRFSDGARGI